jgi:hypothetical protein
MSLALLGHYEYCPSPPSRKLLGLGYWQTDSEDSELIPQQTPSLFQNVIPINFSLNLNGTQIQKGISSEMIFSFNKIVANIYDFFL